MEYIKKSIRIAISVFIPFVILAKLENTYIPYQIHASTATSQFTLYDMKIFFSHTMPLLYVVAFILQGLVIIPLWNKIAANRALKIIVAVDVFSITLTSSFGLAYIVWDSSTGLTSIFASAIVLLFIQGLYWLLIYITLYSMDRLVDVQKYFTFTGFSKEL